VTQRERERERERKRERKKERERGERGRERKREREASLPERAGPSRASFGPLPVNTTVNTGTQETEARDGEKVAALSKRRCSRVEDSRGTTLRERHSGVEHAAAPFSP